MLWVNWSSLGTCLRSSSSYHFIYSKRFGEIAPITGFTSSVLNTSASTLAATPKILGSVEDDNRPLLRFGHIPRHHYGETMLTTYRFQHTMELEWFWRMYGEFSDTSWWSPVVENVLILRKSSKMSPSGKTCSFNVFLQGALVWVPWTWFYWSEGLWRSRQPKLFQRCETYVRTARR